MPLIDDRTVIYIKQAVIRNVRTVSGRHVRIEHPRLDTSIHNVKDTTPGREKEQYIWARNGLPGGDSNLLRLQPREETGISLQKAMIKWIQTDTNTDDEEIVKTHMRVRY